MSTEVTIDKLSIEIGVQTTKAVSGISAVVRTLDSLKLSSDKNISSLVNLTKEVGKLASVSKAVNTANLKDLNKINIGENVGKNLSSLVDGLIKLPTTKLSSLNGLKDISFLNNVKVSSSLGKNLESVGNAIKLFPTNTNSIKSTANSLEYLKSNAGKVVSAFKILDANLKSINTTAQGVNFKNLQYLANFRVAPIGEVTTNNINSIIRAVQLIPENAAAKISSLTPLSQLGAIKISKTTSRNLQQMVFAIMNIPNDTYTKLLDIVSGLSGLERVGKIDFGSGLKQLKCLPEIISLFQKTDLNKFFKQLEKLNKLLVPLSRNVTKLSNAWGSMPQSMRTYGAAVRTIVSANKWLDKSTTDTTRNTNLLLTSFNKIRGVLFFSTSVATGVTSIKNTLLGLIQPANSYIENMNLFQASMGAATEQAKKTGLSFQNLLGIDFGEFARNQGVFESLITGMGEVKENADIMSQQLSQLGYDISSYYNISVEEAMTKIQSGIAGELEPLRRIGWDLSISRMQQEARELGIDKAVSKMTQAEKVALRYYMIMTQMTTVHGDMARTIESPANMIRVMQAQMEITARTIGNVFIPILAKVLPYIIGFVKAIGKAAAILAELSAKKFDYDFSVDYSTVDTSGIASITDDALESSEALEDAKKAADEYKNTVMGFDELNKLTDVNDKTKGISNLDRIGDNLGLGLPTYDFLEGLKSDISRRTDEIADEIISAIKRVFPYLIYGAILLGAWKLANLLKDITALTSMFKLFIGSLALIVGGFIFLWSLGDAIVNGLNWTNLLGMFVGLAVVSLALCATVNTVAAGVALLIGGILILGACFYDAWRNGLNLKNMIGILGGIALAVIGVAIAFGGMAAVVAAVIGAIALLVIGFKDWWDNGSTLENILMIGIGLTAIATIIGFIVGGPAGAAIGAMIGVAATGAVAAAGADRRLQKFKMDPNASRMDSNQIRQTQTLQSNLINAGNGLNSSYSQATALQSSADSMASSVNEYKSETSDLKKQAQKFDSRLAAYGTQVDGMGVTVQNASDSLSDLSNTTNVLNGGVEGLGYEVSDLGGGIGSLGIDIDGFGRDINNLGGDIAGFGSDVNTLGWKTDGLSDSVSGLGGNVWGLGGSVGELGSSVSDLSSSISSLSRSLQQPQKETLPVYAGLNYAMGQKYGNSQAQYGWYTDSKGVLRHYASGGFPKKSQLFVARENGIPEMVGKMGNQTTVANNVQIVDGIKAGVMEAILNVMPAMSSGTSDDRPVEFVINVGNEELARQTYKGLKTLSRRGEIAMSL